MIVSALPRRSYSVRVTNQSFAGSPPLRCTWQSTRPSASMTALAGVKWCVRCTVASA